MSVLLAHPTGSRFVREALRAHGDAGRLAEFWTALAWRPGPWEFLLPASLRDEARRRYFPEVPRSRVRTRPWRELGRLLLPRLGVASAARHETGPCSVDAVYRALDRAVAARLGRGGPPASLHLYEDGALETFRAAARLGLRRVYDLPIGHHAALQALFAEERELCPEFAPMLDGLRDSPAKLARKDEEIALADTILACSPFVAGTLRAAGVLESRIRVVPYGAPEPRPRDWSAAAAAGPLRLLFAGSIGQRKGFGYLLRALRLLGRRDVELVAMGHVVGDAAPLAPYRDLFTHAAPRPHAAVLELMRTCHALVLPSLFEGLALVQLEAMSCGLPVIVTPNTGAEGIVRDGVEGRIVPIRDVAALASAIAELADDRALCASRGLAAAARAGAHGWDAYRAGIDAVFATP